VILNRILPDAEMAEWFAERGMPPIPLDRWSGQWATSHDWELYTDSRYTDFRDYVVERFRGDWGLYLLTHPRFALLAPLQDREARWPVDLHRYYYPVERAGAPAIAAVSALWNAIAGAGRFVVAAYLIVLTAVVLRLRLLRNPQLLMACSLLAGFATQVFLIYHADAMEVA
jgi:hypothetical protein